jgi:Flp pilus assembly protein TadB
LRVFFSRLGWPSGRSWIIAAILTVLCLAIAWLFGAIALVLVAILAVVGLVLGANRRTEELAEKWFEPRDKQ